MTEANCEEFLLQLVTITVIVLFLTTSIPEVSIINQFQYHAAAQIQLNELTSSSSNSNSNGTVITEGFLPYENSNLGIRVQYPAAWELESHTEGAVFLAPLENASDRYYESLNVYVYNPGALEYYPSNDTSLDEIVAGELKSLQRHNDFQLEESNQTTISGNNIPAYKLIYTYSDPNIGLAKAMEVLSTDGKSLYILVYTAKPADYPVHLQTIMKMIDSLQLTRESFILPSTFWTSDNTTVNLSNETGPLSTGAQIAVSGNNVYAVWEDNSNYTENYYKTDIYFAKSTDGGNTFDKPVNISNNKTTISWRAQIAAFGDNVYVVWERYNSTGQGKDDIFFTKSTDAGTTFSKPINLSTDNSHDTSSGMVDIAAASHNGVHVVWFDETSPGVGKIMYTKSSDNGTTFNEPISINDNYTQGLAIEVSQFDTNNVYVVWSDVFGSEAGLFSDKVLFSQSTDGGNSFSEPRNINDNSTAGFLPSIDSSNNSSTVYVVWSEQNATGTEPTGITLVRSLDGGNEFGPPTHFVNITGLFGIAKVVASGDDDDDDDVYIVWNAGQDIFTTSSADGGNIFLGNPMNLSNNRAGFSSFEPDIGASDDALFIVWSTGVEGLLDKEEIMFKKIEK
jgi:hypothetical protein